MGASAAAVTLAISGTSPLKVALPTMEGIHAIIGIGEAVITTAAVSLILKTRPDLVSNYHRRQGYNKKKALHEKTA
jgi:cobalt/nickel transport system permease protein